MKSQEARKYIFKTLNDIADVKFPSNLSSVDKRAERVDRYETSQMKLTKM